MTRQAQALWLEAPGRAALRPVEVPPPGEGEVTVRAVASGVSRGTERLVFEGRVPESQREAMRAPLQQGDFPAPVKYGYASAGVVEAVGPGVELPVGQPVFCLHPHQSAYTIAAGWVTPVPAEVPLGRAVLAANLETAVNATWDAAPRVGDRAVVVGGGVVGLLVAYLLRRVVGVSVGLVDPAPARAPVAEALGVPLAPAPRDADRASADLVVHASGTEAGLADALSLAGVEATVLELSWYGDRAPRVPLGEGFHSRRLKLVSSQVGRIPASRAARWDHARRRALAVSLLADPALDALLHPEVPFADLPAQMGALLSSPETLCARVRYPAGE